VERGTKSGEGGKVFGGKQRATVRNNKKILRGKRHEEYATSLLQKKETWGGAEGKGKQKKGEQKDQKKIKKQVE